MSYLFICECGAHGRIMLTKHTPSLPFFSKEEGREIIKDCEISEEEKNDLLVALEKTSLEEHFSFNGADAAKQKAIICALGLIEKAANFNCCVQKIIVCA